MKHIPIALALLVTASFPALSQTTKFQCERVQLGQPDSGEEPQMAQSDISISGQRMTLKVNGVTWKLSYIGQKSIAKMYSKPDGSVAATFIDGSQIDSPTVLIVHGQSTSGDELIFTLKDCDKVD